MSPAPACLGPPVDVRPLLGPMRAALKELLADLRDRDWDAPTTPGWTVADTVAHLIAGDAQKLAFLRDGGPGPTPHDGESLPAFIDRINEEWVVAFRRLTPRILLGLIDWFSPHIEAMYAGLDLDELGAPVSWAGPDPAPRWLDVAREFTERWVHQQQIREAVGAPLLDDPRFLQTVVDVYLRALPHVLETQALDREEGTLVEVELTGAVSGHWYVRREPDGWCLVAAAPFGHADVVVALDADTVWRLGSRAITPETARELATIEGDDALAEAVLTLVAIIREP